MRSDHQEKKLFSSFLIFMFYHKSTTFSSSLLNSGIYLEFEGAPVSTIISIGVNQIKRVNNMLFNCYGQSSLHMLLLISIRVLVLVIIYINISDI